MRRLAGTLPAWLILMVTITAFSAPLVRAEESDAVVFEPFPENDEAPLIEHLDAEIDSEFETEIYDEVAGEEYADEYDVEPEVIAPGTVEELENTEIINTDELFSHEMASEMAPVLSTADDLGPCNWYTRGDFVLWVRSTPKGGVLAVDTSDISGLIQLRQALEPLNSINGAYRIAPGARITLARNLGRDDSNRDHTVEFVYLGGLEWSGGGGRSSRQPHSLMTPLAPDTLGGFNRADSQRFDVEADFNSVELSLRLQRRPQSDKMVLSPDGRWSRQMNNSLLTSFMAGMRYIRTTEKLHWTSIRNPTTDLFDPVGDGSATGDLNIKADNNLFGLHFGTDTYYHTPKWNLGMRTQFGCMVNMAQQRTRGLIQDTTFTPGPATIPPSPPGPQVTSGPINRDATDQAIAFVGEMGWSATYQLNTRSAFRVSYDFLWMQGIADATRQIHFNSTAPDKVNLGGNVFQQGFSVGYEKVW